VDGAALEGVRLNLLAGGRVGLECLRHTRHYTPVRVPGAKVRR